MIILITGTPGAGKSTAALHLSKKTGFQLISINRIADASTLVGTDKSGSKIVDIKKLSRKIKGMLKKNAIVEGHLSHLLSFGDIVIVLRINPKILKKRLEKKGFGKEKVRENLEAEALDVCLVESLERHENVYEIDTSEKKRSEVLADIISILRGDVSKYMPGKVDWSEEYF